MKMKIYQVDSFSDVPFKGNPAGVMICDEVLSTELIQNIAMEMNLSETAFVMPAGEGYTIRYFTPLKEVPLCGHATLAGAHMIYELGLKNRDEAIFLKAKGADLTIHMNGEWICMNFPQYPLERIETPSGFKELVGFEPVETYSSLYDWVVAVAASEEEIGEVKPEFERLVDKGLGHLMITAESKLDGVDFVARCFAPLMGINEDPVTGSAHCALTPLWSSKLDKMEMNSLQLSRRTGRLRVRMAGEGRVEISGKAVTVFEGELRIS